ncbi:MAG: PQQ-dependent sugar dehydrogenase [bacterium]|nr:PQQ-dependent sugar dehydrogenase [bacterium]MCY3652790.1 PQQ-dependent sugar dehydrogenase [bacterium]MDE0643304.1 PQQ-dependent sugar dehydrogenase [bacterium]
MFRPRSWLLAAVLVVASCGGASEPASLTLAPPPETTIGTSSLEQGPDPVTTSTNEIASTTVASPPPSSPDNPPRETTTTTAFSDETSSSTSAPTSSSTTTTTLPPLIRLGYLDVAEVAYPIHGEPIPGRDVMAVASKEGTVWLIDGNGLHPEPLMEITDRVLNRGEQGLLGLAFAPDYQISGRLLVHYTAHNGDTVIAEYREQNGRIDTDTEAVLWRTSQPAPNHNGGSILFGPDGYLYVGLGDGGGAADRFGHGQNEATPLGALLRFDTSEPGRLTPAGRGFAAPEVWSIGLRNPWRFTIDEISGQILIADVGQNLFEEVSMAPYDQYGLNYGWPITEGAHCFDPPTGCEAEGLTLPVLEVSHDDAGTCSITGGVVYRGEQLPELHGHYLFSDYCGGYLRSFPVDDPFSGVADWTDQVGTAGQVVAFGTDSRGEVYVMNAAGSVLKLVGER